MNKSEKPIIPVEVEIQRHIEEMMRYHKRSKNPKLPIDNLVVPAMSSIQTPQTSMSVIPPMAALQTPQTSMSAIPPMTALQTPQTSMSPDQPIIAVQTPQESFEAYMKANPTTGYLKVKAFTARRAYPVANAVVEVSKNFPGGRYVISELVTNQDGITDVISLPTPQKQLSEVPGNPKPFTTVDVKIKHKDFVEMNFIDVPIFQDITSIQKADLLPTAAAPSEVQSIDIPEYEPSDL